MKRLAEGLSRGLFLWSGRSRRRRLPSLEDHLSDTHRFADVSLSDVDAYMTKLGRTLGVEIKIVAAEAAGMDLEARLGKSFRVAELLYDPTASRVMIYVPDHIRSDGFLYFKCILHELAHLESGHPIPKSDGSEQLWWPPYRLSGRSPEADVVRNEDEADLKAEWSLMIGLSGREIHDRERNLSVF